MEPLHSYQGEHYEEEHTKPHIVYRKSAPKKQTSVENSACDTSGMVYYMMDMHVCNLHRPQIYTHTYRQHKHAWMQPWCLYTYVCKHNHAHARPLYVQPVLIQTSPLRCSSQSADLNICSSHPSPSILFLAHQHTAASEHGPPRGYVCEKNCVYGSCACKCLQVFS